MAVWMAYLIALLATTVIETRYFTALFLHYDCA